MAESARRDAFQAIADPTRRKIIDLVSKKPMNLHAIATHLQMSQPAISQQVKLLQECGIVEIETIGRERYCKVQIQNLVPAFVWLKQFHQQWLNRIDAFEDYVNDLQSKIIEKENE